MYPSGALHNNAHRNTAVRQSVLLEGSEAANFHISKVTMLWTEKHSDSSTSPSGVIHPAATWTVKLS